MRGRHDDGTVERPRHGGEGGGVGHCTLGVDGKRCDAREAHATTTTAGASGCRGRRMRRPHVSHLRRTAVATRMPVLLRCACPRHARPAKLRRLG
jgi:hypothetical protein